MNKKTDLLDDSLFGLWSSQGDPALMPLPHRHNEFELNLVEQGTVVYLFPGRRIELPAGQLFFFWSAVPHQLVDKAPGTHIHWMTLPFAQVMHWRLPESLTRAVLESRPVIGQDDQFIPGDIAAFQRWHVDLQADEAQNRTILLLEVEARLRRLAISQTVSPKILPAPHASAKAEAIASYLSAHFLEEWSPNQASAQVGLHPNYAMQVFQRAYGTTMVEYVTQLRIATAQQLLVTTERDILTVAYECGFGSLSRFYAAFKTVVGMTPRAFRESLNWK